MLAAGSQTFETFIKPSILSARQHIKSSANPPPVEQTPWSDPRGAIPVEQTPWSEPRGAAPRGAATDRFRSIFKGLITTCFAAHLGLVAALGAITIVHSAAVHAEFEQPNLPPISLAFECPKKTTTKKTKKQKNKKEEEE